MEQMDASAVFDLMDSSLQPGGSEAQYFVQKRLAAGRTTSRVLSELVRDYEQQSIFRKEQTFVGVCILHNMIDDAGAKQQARSFLDRYKDAPLSLLNQVECALLRLIRKSSIVYLYPALRPMIADRLQFAPELVRYIDPPTVLSLSYNAELENHRRTFESLKSLPEVDLQQLLDRLLMAESGIEEGFSVARKELSDSERQIGGFEYYGVGGKHYAFRNIMRNLGVGPREDRVADLKALEGGPKDIT
jgi:hypothetical protein